MQTPRDNPYLKRGAKRNLLLLACAFSIATAIVASSVQNEKAEFPPSGTYYSVQRPEMPPLPFCPFPELEIVPLGNGFFVYDDSKIDYELVESLNAEFMESYGGESFSLFGGVEYGTNLHIAEAVVQGNAVVLSLSNAVPDTAYDVYFTPNFETNYYWRLHYRGETNQAEFTVTRPPTDCGFFWIASANDTDEDGITDGFELLVTKTDPENPDSDDNEILDGYEDFDGDGALNFEEFSLKTDPYNADSNRSGVSDGRIGGTAFLTDGIDNNKNDVVDDSEEEEITSGPNVFAGEIKLVGKLRGDNQIGITNIKLLLPFVVNLTDTNGLPITNGSPVSFSAFSPSGANISSLLSDTTAYTGSNGFAGQAQTYLTLTNQTGKYRVQAVWNGITNEFSSETATPLTNFVANARYEPLEDGEIVVSISHTRFLASGTDTNISHVVGVRLDTESETSGVVAALYETFPGSGVYVGSCKTDALQALGSLYAPNSISSDLDEYAGPDTDTEYASADNAEETGSDFSDSDEFDSVFDTWGCTSRGSARSPTTNTFPCSKTFVQAAGFQFFTNNVLGIPIPWLSKNQADFLYISSHGYHDLNYIVLPSGQKLSPGMLRGQWADDLDIVIISGCSVLDVTGDKWPGNPNRPGKKWATLGPKYLLGYEAPAPGDYTGIPVSVLQEFGNRWENLDSFANPSMAWMYANDAYNANNACALDCTVSPKRAWYWEEQFGIFYTLEHKDEPW